MAFLRSVVLYLFNFLLVSGAAKLSLSPSNSEHVKLVGNSFYVSCNADGKNIQRLMWTGPDKKQIINYSGRIHVEESTSSANGLELYNNKVEMLDKGNYTCSANIDGKEVQSSFFLNVFRAAEFTGTNLIQFLEEQNNSTLKCNVLGDPKPRVQWFRHDKLIKTKRNQKYSKHPNNKDWLIIHEVNKKDAGNYTCRTLQLNDDISEIKSITIEVKVNHKPFAPNKHPEESFSFLSGVVNLTCEAVAQPEANFTWSKDNVTLSDNETYKIYNENHTSILEITVNDESQFGDYYCMAQNELGVFKRVVTLEKGRKPSTPHFKIGEKFHDGFRLDIHSQNQPDMPIVAYKVEYKMTGDEWNKGFVKELKTGNNKKYTIRGLKPGTIYVIRISARNIAGYSDVAEAMTSKTLEKSVSGSENISCSLAIVAAAFFFLCIHSKS